MVKRRPKTSYAIASLGNAELALFHQEKMSTHSSLHWSLSNEAVPFKHPCHKETHA